MALGEPANALGRLSREELLALATRVLHANGLGLEDAGEAAEILVLADLFGISTHGVERLPSYVDRMRTGGVDPAAAVTIETVAPALLRVDGNNGLGPVVGQKALRACLAAARQTGLAAAFVRGSNHFGPTIPYTYLATQRGFASIVASNATTTIAPTGGRGARLGNNPLGIGVPNPKGDPVILDMAMSVVARAKIRRAAASGQAIPSTWATDREGQPTASPHEALEGFLLPFGGYKGYGLALMVDLLTGLLSDAAYLTHVSSWVDSPQDPQNLGHFFLCIDTGRLGSQAWLGAAMQDFVGILKDTPATDAAHPVLVPGEMEMNAFKRNSREGIAIPAPLLEKLKAIAR
jgi:LDH2 family malate/lactate/ureidoglycolate dehydrogenase